LRCQNYVLHNAPISYSALLFLLVFRRLGGDGEDADTKRVGQIEADSNDKVKVVHKEPDGEKEQGKFLVVQAAWVAGR